VFGVSSGASTPVYRSRRRRLLAPRNVPYWQMTGPSAVFSFACPWPFQGPGPAAGVALTTSQLPGNISGPGIKTWRHSPLTGFTTVKGKAGAANSSDLGDALVAALAGRDFDRLGRTLAPDVRMRAPLRATRLAEAG